MVIKNSLIFRILSVLYWIAFAIGLYPLQYKKRFKRFKYYKGSTCIGFLLPLLSFVFPAIALLYYVGLAEYLKIDFAIQNLAVTLHITGSITLLFLIHKIHYKKIAHCSTTLLNCYLRIYTRYKRHHFQFDTGFAVILITKLLLAVMQTLAINLDLFSLSLPTNTVVRLTILVSSLIYTNMTVVYLIIGAMFDNLAGALERNYERICADNQPENRAIYFQEAFDLYLGIRNCFEELQVIMNPLWALSGCYLSMSVGYNFWQLYFDTSNDDERKMIIIEVSGFLIMILAASLVSYKGQRFERTLDVFFLGETHSQREDLEWIYFTKNLLSQFNTTILNGIRLSPFYSVISCIILVNTIELFLSKNELFQHEEEEDDDF